MYVGRIRIHAQGGWEREETYCDHHTVWNEYSGRLGEGRNMQVEYCDLHTLPVSATKT